MIIDQKSIVFVDKHLGWHLKCVQEYILYKNYNFINFVLCALYLITIKLNQYIK